MMCIFYSNNLQQNGKLENAWVKLLKYTKAFHLLLHLICSQSETPHERMNTGSEKFISKRRSS